MLTERLEPDDDVVGRVFIVLARFVGDGAPLSVRKLHKRKKNEKC